MKRTHTTKGAAKPTKNPPVAQTRSATEHKKVFDQLLDDAVLGVKKKRGRRS